MIIGIEVKFDAAHYLPTYKGKCANMHGHTWHIKVEIFGPVHTDGMVMDLTELKSKVNKLIERFDHKVLNDILTTPTCENLALFIRDQLMADGLNTLSITVREGEGGWARI